MTYYTVSELAREVRKPGMIEADVNGEHDVSCLLVQKADLLRDLSTRDQGGESPWRLIDVGHNTRRLSVITDFDRRQKV